MVLDLYWLNIGFGSFMVVQKQFTFHRNLNLNFHLSASGIFFRNVRGWQRALLTANLVSISKKQDVLARIMSINPEFAVNKIVTLAGVHNKMRKKE